MIIFRDISAFCGDGLIVGCGHTHEHLFTFSDENSLLSSVLHPENEFYTINNNSESSTDETNPDLVADFCNYELLVYLQNKKFSFICFERIASIFIDIDLTRKSLQNAFKLLKNDGVCFIYGGGRNLSPALKKTLTSVFQYNILITYGEGNTWSLLASNNLESLTKYESLKADNKYYAMIFKKMNMVDDLTIQHIDREDSPLKKLLYSLFFRQEKAIEKSILPEKQELLMDHYYLMNEDGSFSL